MSFCLHLLIFIGALHANSTPSSCLVGTDPFYVNQFNKPKLDPEKDSFLAYYREHIKDPSASAGSFCTSCQANYMTPEARQKLNATQQAINSAGEIPSKCISDTAIYRKVSGNKNYCDSRDSGVSTKKPTPCVSQDIMDYISWSINKAIACLSPANDPIEPETIYKMFNLESAFSFYIYGPNGIGVAQLTTSGLEDIAGYSNVEYLNSTYDKNGHIISKKKLQKQYGKAFLDNIIYSSKKECEPFKKVRDYDIHISALKDKKGEIVRGETGAHIPVATTCQLTSLGDGIARNILDGIGLYLYYRGVDFNSMSPEDSKDCLANHCVGASYSADRKLQQMNLNFASKKDYLKVRSWMAMSLYNSADASEGQGAISAMKPFLRSYVKNENAITKEDLLEILKKNNAVENNEEISTTEMLKLAKKRHLIKATQTIEKKMTAKDFLDVARSIKVLKYPTASEKVYTPNLHVQCGYPDYL